ncbi:aminopeptidase P family protein [Dongia sp.]|uniref:aminopeptidase P family protein n=1 Tax=Dongia sp. TaxID=1977262 RepID=UPI0035B2BE79
MVTSPDSACRETYQGDEALAGLLKKHQAHLNINALTELLPGIAAAPAGEKADAWIDLVAHNPSPALIAQLQAFRREKESREATTRAQPIAARLTLLREALKRQGLDGFIIGRADEHQGEYVPKNAERLAYVSGFTGSAGMAVVLGDKAAIFVDGRYTIQVKDQVDPALYIYRHLVTEPADAYIAAEAKPGQKIGFDPKLFTPDQAGRFRAAAKRAGADLVAVAKNPVDEIWAGRPADPISPVLPHDIKFAGEASGEKRRRLAERLKADGRKAAVISGPDSLCWLLNIRGADVPRTPFALGFAVLHDDARVDLYMDRRKLTPSALAHLGNEVAVMPPDAFGDGLAALGSSKASIAIDGATASEWVYDTLAKSGARVSVGECVCALPKAAKNETEVQGSRNAHTRDGASIARYLAWLSVRAPKGGLKEIEASDQLASYRHGNEYFRNLSFDSISAAGPNGAICHYHAMPETQREIPVNSLYLIDSGGQYLDGTTDITRTVAVGTPTQEMKECFTRVLKGHIALGTARFPRGTTGSALDALARKPLWDVGLDYDHGTGHGVGSYLSVHEGPQRISKVPNRVALEPGMIISNEPGYYKEGEFGIRIENLVVVRDVKDHPGWLEFETLTLAPIDLNAIEKKLLTAEEIAWLNAYHARVRAALAPQLSGSDLAWLNEATRAI